MIEKFLNAKHWQLFLIIIGLPLILQFFIFSSFNLEENQGQINTSLFMIIFPIIMIITTAVFFGWFWSIATGLREYLLPEIIMKYKKFKIFFFIPLIYIIIISIFVGITMSGIKPNPLIFLIIVPMHLLSMFGIFYSLYFVAKTIKTVELKRDTKFDDFIGEFFLIWFFPIGIWIIQPRINKLTNKI